MLNSMRDFSSKARQRNVAIITTNSETKITTVNAHAAALFEYEAEELLGKSVKVLMRDPYREQHDSYVKRYIKTGMKNVMHTKRIVECCKKSGQQFAAFLSLSEVRSGTDLYFLGALTPLEEDAALFEANQDGTILTTNDSCTSLFGFLSEEMVGHNLSMLMPDAHASRHNSYIDSYMKSGRKKVIDKTRNVSAKHRDGTLIPVALQVTERPPSKTETEKGCTHIFIGKLTAVGDIDAVLTLSSEGQIKSSSSRSVLLFGFSTDELTKKTIFDLIPSLDEKEPLLDAGQGVFFSHFPPYLTADFEMMSSQERESGDG